MLFSGLPRSTLMRLVQAADPGATFDVKVPIGKSVGGLVELRLTSGYVPAVRHCRLAFGELTDCYTKPRRGASRIPLRVKDMKAWLAELGEASDEEQVDIHGSRRSSPPLKRTVSPTSLQAFLSSRKQARP